MVYAKTGYAKLGHINKEWATENATISDQKTPDFHSCKHAFALLISDWWCLLLTCLPYIKAIYITLNLCMATNKSMMLKTKIKTCLTFKCCGGRTSRLSKEKVPHEARVILSWKQAQSRATTCSSYFALTSSHVFPEWARKPTETWTTLRKPLLHLRTFCK